MIIYWYEKSYKFKIFAFINNKTSLWNLNLILGKLQYSFFVFATLLILEQENWLQKLYL
jgi:hypothetical protein